MDNNNETTTDAEPYTLPLELQIGAVVMTLFAVALLFKVFIMQRPKNLNSWDRQLDDMINGYELTIPPESEEYKKLKASNPSDKKALSAALFRRALSLIPLANRLQGDSYGMNRLKRSDILRDAAFNSFSGAERMIEAEIKQVQQEANILRPDIQWGKSIFPQAAQLFQQMKTKEAAKKKEVAAAIAAKQAQEKKAAVEASMAAKQEKAREDAVRSLLSEEESKKSK